MPRESPALAERERDLTSLVAALAHPPAIAVVDGEAGIGKSHLVREALADRALADRRWLFGSARPTLASCPLGPVIEALATAKWPPVRRLSPLVGVLRAVLPDLADILPPAPPPLQNPQLVRHRLVRATAELLSGLGPTILVLEDLQWADETTVELLRMIVAAPAAELSIAITCRSPAALPISGATIARVHLPPLSPQAAGRLAGVVLGEPETVMPRELADRLHERSGGVPLVVREDALLLRQRGLLRQVNGKWALGEVAEPDLSAAVPPAVGAEILARVRGLGADGATVLEAAALLAGPAEPELVARVAALSAERTSVALGDAIRCGLLRDDGPDAVRFQHELARLAIYQAMPGHLRRRLHAAAARELGAAGDGAMTVRAIGHHRLAGDIPGWAASAEAAAEDAAAGGSFDAAHDYLRDILLAGAVANERRAAIAIKLGWVALGDADKAKAVAALLDEVRADDTVPAAQRSELRLLRVWSSLEHAGAGRETDAMAAEVHAAIGDLAPRLQAIALAVLATPSRLPERDVRAQAALVDEARTALARTADPMAHAVVEIAAAHLLLATGNPAGWAAAEALTAHPDRPDVDRQTIRGLLDLAEATMHLGHHSRAMELVEQGRRLAACARSRTYDSRLRATALRVRWTMGDLEAEDRVSVLSDDPRVQARLLWAQMRTEQGRTDTARRTLRAVAEEARETGDLAVAAQAVAEINRVALNAAHRRVGHTYARQILDALERKQNLVWAAPLLPFVPLDLVRTVLPGYRAALEGLDAPLARAALGFAEARLSEQDGDPERASAGYRRARNAYAALPDVRLMAHACAAEVRCQILAGQEPDIDLLRHAWSTFTGLDAAWDADRLKRLMQAAGMPVPHRRGRPGYGNQLSPREREVADLAASGHTNRDIAAKLYLSDRTVKYHLGNAMRKLEVTSRRRLRDVLEPGISVAAGPAQAPVDHTCRCVECGRAINPSLLDRSYD